VGLYWLKYGFDPATREKAGGKPRLLLCDGHDSHISAEFVCYCIQHGIFLHLLLPHSSHLLQPLDISCFGPLKKAVSAQEAALIPDNIQGGWRGAGLVPLN